MFLYKGIKPLATKRRKVMHLLSLNKAMYKEGKLNDVQARFLSDERPAEEFYDLWEDPHEINNLIHSYKYEHAIELAKHRDFLSKWIIETDDKGRFPETDEGLKAVIEVWGDKAVNKEYEGDEINNQRK